MRISVIIPTYKPKEYLWECLESLAAQTLDRSHFEIILVLNGCNQPWAEEIKSWIQAHPDIIIKFIQTDQPGVSNARNIGLSNATGQFITFIDDDDYVSPEYLAALLNASKEDTVVLSNSISFSDGQMTFDKDYPIRKQYYSLKDQDRINLVHARRLFNGPCMKLIPRTIINGFKFNCAFKNGEDSLFMFEISKNIVDLNLAEESAVYYRRFRIGSATTRNKEFSEKIKNTTHLLAAYCKAFAKAPFRYNTWFFLTRLAATIKGHLLTN